LDDVEARERVARVETLLEELDSLADSAAREKATELVAALLDVYGEGLSRIVAQVAERDDGALAEALAGDELVSHLLLLHGLHPVPLEASWTRCVPISSRTAATSTCWAWRRGSPT
jgi:hypothetical protein